MRRPAVLLALVALAAAARAEVAPPDDPITVTGTRLTPGEVRARADDFVRAIGIAAGDVLGVG